MRASLATGPFDSPFPVPEYPPADWFDGPPTWVAAYRDEQGLGPDVEIGPGGEPIMKLTVTDDGRVGGWFFEHGQCLVHMPDACPGPSPTGYAAFHQGDEVTAEGTMVRVGVIGNTHGHASPWVNWREAQKHYADPSAQLIVCRAGDDDRGGWIAGAMIPGTTYADVALCRRSALSGDWRPDFSPAWFQANGATAAGLVASDGYDCVGPTLVTRPGLPLTSKAGTRRFVLAASVAAPELRQGDTVPAAVTPERTGTKERRPVLVAGVTIEETRMGTEVVLPDGTKVKVDAAAGETPAEPVVETEPVTAATEPITAAPGDAVPPADGTDAPVGPTTAPDAPDAEDAAEGAPTLESLAAEIEGLETRLTAVEDFLEQMLESEMAAILDRDVPLPAAAGPPVDDSSVLGLAQSVDSVVDQVSAALATGDLATATALIDSLDTTLEDLISTLGGPAPSLTEDEPSPAAAANGQAVSTT